jgi:hypothetical protein
VALFFNRLVVDEEQTKARKRFEVLDNFAADGAQKGYLRHEESHTTSTFSGTVTTPNQMRKSTKFKQELRAEDVLIPRELYHPSPVISKMRNRITDEYLIKYAEELYHRLLLVDRKIPEFKKQFEKAP